MCEDLEKLISLFQENQTKENKNLKHIPHCEIVLAGLQELQQIPDNNEMKQDIVDQITSIILIPSIQNDESLIMINVLFYGPLDVLKTSICLILGKIWYGMGLLKQKDVNVDVDDIVTILNPSYFIDRDSEKTSENTRKILEENLGKVLLVDEAHDFVNDDQVSFGKYALNEMSTFLNEHPGEIIVIFSGDEDMIEENILKVNPSLRRRFTWKFECSDCKHDDLNRSFYKS